MMMNNLEPAPAVPSPRDVSTLLALVELLADPAATKARIAELNAANANAEKLLAEAIADRAKAAAARLQADKDIAAKRAEHDERMQADRDGFLASKAAQQRELDEQQKKLNELRAQAEADAKAAADLKSDLERRFRLVTAA